MNDSTIASLSILNGSKLRFDLLVIYVLPITAALGTYLLPVEIASVSFYLFRVLVIIFFALAVVLKSKLSSNLLTQNYIFLVVWWLFWGAASGFWSPDPMSAFKDFFALCLGVGASLLLILFSNGSGRLEYLRKGWVVAYILTAAVAVWEIVTGQHLPSAFVDNSPDYLIKKLFVTSTFGNPNNYAAFLVLCFPFLVWQFLSTKSLSNRLIVGLLLLVFPVFILLTGSRMCFVGWVVELLALSVLLMSFSKRLVFFAVIGLISFYAITSGMLDDLQLVDKMMKAANAGSSKGSIFVRINMTLNGFWMFSESYGFGVGMGGFEQIILHHRVPYITHGISNPHNFFVEIFAEYGLLTGIFFLVFILMSAIYSARFYLSQLLFISRAGGICLISILGYLFATIANSSYIEQPVNWVYLGTLIGILSSLTVSGEQSFKHLVNGNSLRFNQ